MSPNPVPKIRGVVETALSVAELPRAVAFYRDVLGLAPIAGDEARFQAFDSGDGRVVLLFGRGATIGPMATPGGVIPGHGCDGRQHIGFAIAADTYEAWRERLRAEGIAIESEVAWPPGGRSVYFRDPDGHLVELITPGIWPVY